MIEFNNNAVCTCWFTLNKNMMMMMTKKRNRERHLATILRQLLPRLNFRKKTAISFTCISVSDALRHYAFVNIQMNEWNHNSISHTTCKRGALHRLSELNGITPEDKICIIAIWKKTSGNVCYNNEDLTQCCCTNLRQKPHRAILAETKENKCAHITYLWLHKFGNRFIAWRWTREEGLMVEHSVYQLCRCSQLCKNSGQSERIQQPIHCDHQRVYRVRSRRRLTTRTCNASSLPAH